MDARPGAVAAIAAPFGRDVDAALRRIAATVRAARGAGARLVVFPESALGGYLLETEPGTPPAPDMLPPALDPEGPEIARLSLPVAHLGAWIDTNRHRLVSIEPPWNTR